MNQKGAGNPERAKTFSRTSGGISASENTYKKSMRILLLTPLYPPAIGGAASYFADILPRLEAYPTIDRLLLLTERMPGEPREMTTGKLTVLRLLPTRVSAERPYPMHALTYLQTQLWLTINLPRLVTKYRLDLLHFHTRYRGRLFYRALSQLPVPVLADLRDKMSDPAALAACSQHLLCCAQGVVDFATAGGYPVEHTSHIPIPFVPPTPLSETAVQAARQHLGLSERPFLLYLGDMTVNKGVYELLAAFAQWQQAQPGVDLVLAGMNREGRPFIERIRQVPQTHFLGHIPHAQALALMQAAEMALLPSRSEGLPLTILEAVALGKKVLCPPNIPEFEAHLPEFVLPEVTVEAIQTTLTKIWRNPTLPNYPLADHQVGTIVDQIVVVYRRLIKKGK
jgi:glycosyltransferase involved in cell wall biosynthesis